VLERRAFEDKARELEGTVEKTGADHAPRVVNVTKNELHHGLHGSGGTMVRINNSPPAVDDDDLTLTKSAGR